jgi:lipid II:glycine glycyltransferase (peptidoglycan interpeptide bridge formation enzyme)
MYENILNKNFLQSNEWREFQGSVGRKTFLLQGQNFSASIIEHELPVVGSYFYVPKGPILKKQEARSNKQEMKTLIDSAKKEKAGWIRVEPENNEVLKLIKNNTKNKIIKSPHDMQPKETLIMDISKSEEELLKEMKSKTRYNIRLAKKKEVRIKKQEVNGEYIQDFLRLNKIMSDRQGIATHEDEYYRKMFELIPGDILKLYVAEYQDKIIAANIVAFYDDTAHYLHGASDDKYRNVMATYLLQWRQIQDAKKTGCTKYDFCGVKVKDKNGRSWEGITRFKLGFSPKIKTVEFPGSYDIVLNPVRYGIYRSLQFIKRIIG